MTGRPDDEDSARALLAWYDRQRRDLPWRRSRDPWPVWVSEVMLQQTRVDTVIAYYDGFLERFPDVAALAAADEQEVLAAWSGLGYYRRARSLHQAARRVTADGAFPTGRDAWRQLPGVGEYTAAALASIVDGEPVAVLDGNVERVTSRWRAIAGDPRRRRVRDRLRAAAEALLDPRRPGDANQALMELGATICRPMAPLCHTCPLSRSCEAYESGSPEAYPTPKKRRAIERVRRRLFVVVDDQGRFALWRHGEEASLLAGLWEFPFVDGGGSDRRQREELTARYGGRWQLGERLGELRHAITHRSLRVAVARAERQPPADAAESPRYVRRRQLEALPTTALTRKVAALLDQTVKSTTGVSS